MTASEAWAKICEIAKRKRWTYCRALNTFVFVYKYVPPCNLPGMPIDEFDWMRWVGFVPQEALHK